VSHQRNQANRRGFIPDGIVLNRCHLGQGALPAASPLVDFPVIHQLQALGQFQRTRLTRKFAMPTLVKLDTDRIVCKTIAEERLFFLMFAGIGTPMLMAGVYVVTHTPIDNPNLLGVVTVLLFLLAPICGAFHIGLRREWLVIDPVRKRYTGRRGPLLWAEALRGSLDDLDRIRLVRATADPTQGCPDWAFEFVWRGDSHRPFRVTHWKRPRSFHLEGYWGERPAESLLHILKALSQYTGLPLEIPKTYLNTAGLFDMEIDV
jgi:hypothetical protein